MVEEIIAHNIRVFSREMEKLRMQKVLPVERVRALQNHLKALEQARKIPEKRRAAWVKLLVERARKDPALEEELKSRLIDVYA